MKRIYNLTLVVLIGFFTGGTLTSCVSDDTLSLKDEEQQSMPEGMLTINYKIGFPDEVSTTYAGGTTMIQTAAECKINNIHALFFYPADHPDASLQNKFVGYARTSNIRSGGSLPKNQGTASFALPDEISKNSKIQVILLANFDEFAFRGTYTSIGQMIEALIRGETINKARQELKLFYQDNKGMDVEVEKSKVLPMSAEATYPGNNTTPLHVEFERRVARVDLVNNCHDKKVIPEGSTTEVPLFILKSAKLYNVNMHAYATKNGHDYLIDPSGEDYIDFDEQAMDLSQNNKSIEGRFYAFPNYVTQPTLKDKQTTCLVVEGFYQGSEKATFYRINVTSKTNNEHQPQKEQTLLANGLYTININNVTGGGKGNEDEALGSDAIEIDYTINEWDESMLETHAFDEHGNALSVSHRNISFSNKGGQQLPIDVYTKQSKTHPITTPWSVSLEQLGDIDYSDKFEIIEDQANNKFNIKTKEDNSTMTDWVAYAKVSWGGIDIYISLTQLSPYSTLKGITVFPKDLIVINESSTRKLGVNTQGNFDGLDISHITHSIMYSDDSNTDWITRVRPSAPQTQLDQGIYYFDVDIKAQEANATSRTAIIKFVVKNGKHIASAEASITQSPTKLPEKNNEGLTINMYLYNKEPDAGQQPTYVEKRRSDIVGLSPALTRWGDENSLLFSQAPADQIYYHLHITSDFDWQIETDKSTGNNLKFETLSVDDSTGKTKTTVLKVSPVKDAPHAWAGEFKIKYENGSARTFFAAQEGVYRQFTDATDSPVHFYGIINYRNQLWLDRNLGDLKSAKYDNAVYANVNNTWYSHNTKVYNIQELNRNCPPGWALPNATEALNFVESIRNNNGTLQVLTSLPTIDPDEGGAHDPNSKSKYYDLSKSAQYLGGANDERWYGSTETDEAGTSSLHTFSIATSHATTYVHVLFSAKGRKIWTTTRHGEIISSSKTLDTFY